MSARRFVSSASATNILQPRNAASQPGLGAGNTGLWLGITPVLLLPMVGNVVAPLGGLPLGIEGCSAA